MSTLLKQEDTTPESLRYFLTEGQVRVTFKKVNGDTRIMTCTLIENLIPIHKIPGKTPPPINISAWRVFDMEKGEWRSFRFDSIISVEIL